MVVSNRLDEVPASPIRILVPLAQAAERQGVTVYHLNIGDPDIKTPEVMLEVLRHWRTNPISYEHSQGNFEFMEALKGYYHSLGFGFIKKKHLQVTVGGSEALAMAMFSVADPGEEIIVFEPFYANYNTYAVFNGVRLVPVATSIVDGFHLPDSLAIEAAITKKTKAILFCNPNNPTGTVYRKEEIDRLVELAKKHHLYLLSDEVYREFVYDGRKHISLFSYMREMSEQIIILDSLSKRYSLCGARLGVLASLNEEIMEGTLRLAQGRLSAGLIDQAMAAKLDEVPASYFKRVNQEYAKRRDLFYDGLKKISGVVVPKPEGAFYMIVGLPVSNAQDFCRWLLTDFRDNQETVMLAPAAGFYASPELGKNEVRIAYVLSRGKLKRSVELLGLALQRYRS